MFADAIEAWPHGPVCPTAYHHYKRYGSGLITAEATVVPGTFTDAQTELLEEVNEIFGQFSAWKLRDMTHEETPWQEHEATASVILVETMQRYFKTRTH